MVDADKKLFAEMLSAVMSQYGKDTSTSVVQLWWASLAGYDFAAVRKAFSAWVQNPDEGQYAPKIANIIRMIDGATGDRAMLAWSMVDKAIRRIGHYTSVAFEDPIIHRVIEDMGGWMPLASTSTDKDLEFRGLEFIKRYRALALPGAMKDYPRYLIGAAEAHNATHGHLGYDGVKMIGNPELVKKVFAGGNDDHSLAISSEVGLDELSGEVKKIADMT